MTKKLEPDGYSRNPKYSGRVYPIPNGYGTGHGIGKKIFRGYETGMGFGDTRSNYPKPCTRLPEPYA
ncbi:hypothetical protein HanRHA438_Chr07g0314531 [Helianthus annuus]|nr:hypothetical protein HanRHA438_Chr07g0314531 [Helianthus annuus]